MARTGLFRALRKIVRHSRLAQRTGMSDAEYAERLSTAQNLPRRTLLKNSALTLAAAPLAQQIGMGRAQASEDDREFEGGKNRKIEGVLILGGGASGLAAAFQCHKPRQDEEGVKMKPVPFTIVEGSNRWGGRMFTKNNFNSNQFVEMGGELVDTGHDMVFDLCKWLGLELESFASRESKNLAETLYNFNGRLYDHEEIAREVRPLVKHINKVVGQIYTTKSGEEYDGYLTYHAKNKLAPAFKKYDNMTLNQFLCDAPGAQWMREAVDVAYRGEYGLETNEQSALNLTELFDDDLSDGFTMFGPSDEAYRIKGGSSQLTDGMKSYLQSSKNPHRKEGDFIKGHMLIAVRQNANGSIRCVFRRPEGGQLHLDAWHVICTLPFSTLRNVDMSSLPISNVKKHCISKIGYGTNSKVMLGFESTFWRNQKLLGSVPASMGEFYGDFRSANFWETSRLQGGANRKGILTNYLGGREGLKAGLNNGRPDQGARNATQALKDLSEIFGNIPQNQFIKGRVAVANWSTITGGFQDGSYACLLPGQFGSLWGSSGEAELKGRLLFAGEHTSLDYYGYMNGAVDSGFKTAKKLRNFIHNNLKTIASAS